MHAALRHPDPPAGDVATAARRSQFDAACQRAGAELQAQELWCLHVGTPRRRGWPLQDLLDDHAAWREFRLARAGNPTAAAAFHGRWTRYVARFGEGRFSHDDVREITSLFFERAWRLVEGNFAWQCPFGMYLRAMVVNLARDAWGAGRLRREREAPLSEAEGVVDSAATFAMQARSPEAMLLERAGRERLQRALARLAPGDRRLILQMLVEGRDGRSLALEMGIERQALYQRLHRARRRLRQYLGSPSGEGSTVGAGSRAPLRVGEVRP